MTHVNRRNQNILHACADGKLNRLLVNICTETQINIDSLKIALSQSDVNGMTPMHLCTDEETIIQIMEKITSRGIRISIGHVDKKGNNTVHIYAKRNFVYCLRKIFKLVADDEKIRDILAQKNHHGNNPLMSCVFKNSTDALNFLLCTLFTMDFDCQNNEFMWQILHSENNKGETLLGNILHYQQNTPLPETIALQMEKMCHMKVDDKPKTMEKLTECLKSHVEPSNEVMVAMKEVEDSYEKTMSERCTVWFNLFISSFLVPSIVMVLDIAFDVLLVLAYFYAAYNLLTPNDTTKTILDDNYFNSTCGNSTLSTDGMNTWRAELLYMAEIPKTLTDKSRFYYALAFLVIPWIFYAIEFCHSRHLQSTIKQVRYFPKIIC